MQSTATRLTKAVVSLSIVLFSFRYVIIHFEILHTTEEDYETFKKFLRRECLFFKNQETFSQYIALIVVLLISFSGTSEGDEICSLS